MNENKQALADALARDAHENNFSSRQGVYAIENEFVVFYSNNPVADRLEFLVRFEAYLLENGFGVTERGSYPKTGDDRGYTIAMLIKATEADAGRIADAAEAIHVGITKGLPFDGRPLVDMVVNQWAQREARNAANEVTP